MVSSEPRPKASAGRIAAYIGAVLAALAGPALFVGMMVAESPALLLAVSFTFPVNLAIALAVAIIVIFTKRAVPTGFAYHESVNLAIYGVAVSFVLWGLGVLFTFGASLLTALGA